MKTSATPIDRIERRLRIQIRRRKIVAATPVAVRHVPLLFRRKNPSSYSLQWEISVTEYATERPSAA